MFGLLKIKNQKLAREQDYLSKMINTKDDKTTGAVGGARPGDTGLRELFPLSNTDCFSTSMDQNNIVIFKTCFK